MEITQKAIDVARAETKRLKLNCNNLKSFPLEVLQLGCSLEVLDLSNNGMLKDLPDEMNLLNCLKIGFFSNCGFKVFPKQLAQCPLLEMIAFRSNQMEQIPEDAFPKQLKWLILTDNKISEIPKSIGLCSRLQKCMLAGNQLMNLPLEMANCTKLGLLRLAANKFTQIPDWLFALPELAFLGVSGNPCIADANSNTTAVDASLPDVSWSSLTIGPVLGGGASGVIYNSIWHTKQQQQQSQEEGDKQVAVKLYKGELTSDGLPIDEMNACIAAGSHPNLIDPLGKLCNHPDNKLGLVLQLISSNFKNLGLPPSMESCTRDVFHPETHFTVPQIKKILIGIASAMQHLHKKGITHGDLYAHNILIDDTGYPLLGDFGAATIHNSSSSLELFEKLEICAFGHLIQDLTNLVVKETKSQEEKHEEEKEMEVLIKLNALHQNCVNRKVMHRPATFKEVHQQLIDI